MRKITAMLAVFITAAVFAETPAAFAFLSSGAGARALGMGGAFTAVAGDASALYWNPAGLAGIDIYKTHFTGMFTNMDHNRLMGFAGLYEKMENGAGSAGLSLYYFRVGEIEGRDAAGAATGEFEYNAGVFSASYANVISDSLKAGLSVKYYYASVLETAGRGFGADLGLLFKPLGPYFSAGLVLKDLNTGINWDTGRVDYVKTTLTLGAVQSLIYEKFIVSFEVEGSAAGTLRYRAGGEYIFNNTFSVRLGLNQGDLATGFGVSYQNYRLDYAFALDKDGFADVHRFSFSAGY